MYTFWTGKIFLSFSLYFAAAAADRYDDKCTQRIDKVQSVQAQGLQTLPQAKRHQPSLLFTSLAILTSLTFITR